MSAPDDDAMCVSRCLRGDTAAFEALVLRYQRVLYTVAYRLTADHEDARDVTQNAFMRAFEHLETYDPTRKFFSWLYRIAVNESLNFRRGRRVHQPIEAAGPPVVTDDPVERIAAEERIQAALMALGAGYREVIVMRYFADLSYEEIGQALGIPEKTVKSRLFTARQQLSHVLAPGWSPQS
ncbi:MAG TPA: RNA polymerase sigma factor [Vicinamibacterales bacterium]|nr:RNA polymerase sigma factor [Vicinamibacterales bacterium]